MVATSIDFDKVNPTFIDCNFPSQPRFTFGCQPPNQLKEFCSGLRAYEDVEPPIASSQWIEIAKRNARQRPGRNGSFLGFTINRKKVLRRQHEVAAMRSAAAGQWGLDASCICRRFRSTSGSALRLKVARTSKTQPSKRISGVSFRLTLPENRAVYGNAVMPNTGWRTPFPADWEQTAAMFCDDEQFVVRTYAGARLGTTPQPYGRHRRAATRSCTAAVRNSRRTR